MIIIDIIDHANTAIIRPTIAKVNILTAIFDLFVSPIDRVYIIPLINIIIKAIGAKKLINVSAIFCQKALIASPLAVAWLLLAVALIKPPSISLTPLVYSFLPFGRQNILEIY